MLQAVLPLKTAEENERDGDAAARKLYQHLRSAEHAATELDAEDSRAWRERGRCFWNLLRYEEAEACAQEACKISKRPSSLFVLGGILFDQEKYRELIALGGDTDADTLNESSLARRLLLASVRIKSRRERESASVRSRPRSKRRSSRNLCKKQPMSISKRRGNRRGLSYSRLGYRIRKNSPKRRHWLHATSMRLNVSMMLWRFVRASRRPCPHASGWPSNTQAS